MSRREARAKPHSYLTWAPEKFSFCLTSSRTYGMSCSFAHCTVGARFDAKPFPGPSLPQPPCIPGSIIVRGGWGTITLPHIISAGATLAISLCVCARWAHPPPLPRPGRPVLPFFKIKGGQGWILSVLYLQSSCAK